MVHTVHPLNRFRRFRPHRDVVGDVNPPNHQDSVFGFDLACHLRPERSLRRLDPARRQRTSEGSRQSPAGGSDHVVEGGGLRFHDRRIHAIVLGDLGVDPERYGLGGGGERCMAKGTSNPLDSD